jgi:branched-chain amino acid aminotransferase
MHPAAHVFHYASTCFEGFKAYRWQDGNARIFRLRDHIRRMQNSARSLRLPVPDADQLAAMVTDLVVAQIEDIPAPPSSLYLRPTLIGTLENIGAAAAPSTEATLFVLASPVGDYFQGGARALKLRGRRSSSAARRRAATTPPPSGRRWTPRRSTALTRYCSVRTVTFRKPVRRISC